MNPTLQLQIGTHRFKVRVSENDKAATLAAAKRIEKMLLEMRQKGNVADGERAAIMVALQLAGHGKIVQTRQDGDLGKLEGLLDEALETLQDK